MELSGLGGQLPAQVAPLKSYLHSAFTAQSASCRQAADSLTILPLPSPNWKAAILEISLVRASPPKFYIYAGPPHCSSAATLSSFLFILVHGLYGIQ